KKKKKNKTNFVLGYSYIDANGLMQTVSYTADAEKGFQVHASNMPGRDNLSPVEDTPEVALAKRRHLDQLHRVESWQNQQQPWLQRQYHHQQQQQPEQDNYNHEAEQPVSRSQKSRSPFLLSSEEARSIPPAPRPSNAIVAESAAAGGASGPSNADVEFPRRFTATSASAHHHYQLIPTAAALPLVMPLPLIHSSMRHSQDSLGQYEYSYTGDTSAKTESRSLDGTTRGAYSYIDANGLLQQVHYIADRDGFRVLATNLPEA
ncbi:uncharacterized protein LOC106646494, partial [Copidosoma floridanum]|uniref:uncharacterized protein LOC106646494 n=1 Tax=Copidosoma floridanum TaxID=29053 RepID=UPI0006C9CD18